MPDDAFGTQPSPVTAVPVPIAQGGTGAASAAAGLAALGGLVRQQNTGAAGFALQNGTPNLMAAWNVPNDGNSHTMIITGQLHTTVAATGGQINVAYTQPDGNAQSTILNNGGNGVGTSGLGGSGTGIFSREVQAGSTVTVSQGTALTAGTVQAFASIWGV